MTVPLRGWIFSRIIRVEAQYRPGKDDILPDFLLHLEDEPAPELQMQDKE